MLPGVLIAAFLLPVATPTAFKTRQVLASPDIPVTSFSCEDRPIGYYADLETNCKVYHMCGGSGGLQYSYRCPNTTLFHQRMLVCAHWYQVNCSRSEQDYSANLLIGQKDSLFLDHPYSLKEEFGDETEALQRLTPETDRPGVEVHSYGAFRDVVRGGPSTLAPPRPRPTNVSFRSTIETPLSAWSARARTPPMKPATEPVTAVEPPARSLLPPVEPVAEPANTVELYLPDSRRDLYIPGGGRREPEAEARLVVAIPLRRQSRFSAPLPLKAPQHCSRCHPMFVLDKDNCSPCLLIS